MNIARWLRFSFSSSVFQTKKKGEAGFEKTFPIAKIKDQLPKGKGGNATASKLTMSSELLDYISLDKVKERAELHSAPYLVQQLHKS